jgi:hypothetical protein
MILQRHTGSHLAAPLPKPVVDTPVSPDAEKKKSEQTQDPQAGKPCQAESDTRD